MELKPKTTAPSPIAPLPIPCHPCVASLRITILLEPVLLNCLRDLMYVAASLRTKHSTYDSVRNYWTMQCEGSEFFRAVHLLTLALHVIADVSDSQLPHSSNCDTSSNDNKNNDDNSIGDSNCNANPLTLTPAHQFVSFLLEEITMFIPSAGDMDTSSNDSNQSQSEQLPHLLW